MAAFNGTKSRLWLLLVENVRNEEESSKQIWNLIHSTQSGAGSLRPGLSGDPAAGGATFWYLINTLPAHRRPARVKFSTSRCQHKNPANCHHSAIFRSHLSSCTTVPQPIIVSLHRIGHPVVVLCIQQPAKYYCNKMKSETQKQHDRQIGNRILESFFVIHIFNC